MAIATMMLFFKDAHFTIRSSMRVKPLLFSFT